jgi:aquaporin NIP
VIRSFCATYSRSLRISIGINSGSGGVAVGTVIALEALFAGPVCGASMNPARSLAPALVSGNLRDLWIYLLAPIAGAIVAVPLCGCMLEPANSKSHP